MKPEPATEIEVEVVEVDGLAPLPKAPDQTEHSEPNHSAWPNWQGRVRRLDSRWWPLWVLLGAIALVFLFTFGLVVAVVFIFVRLVTRLLRALFR